MSANHMIFNNSTEYAIRGLSELASRSNGNPMLLDQLVIGNELPRAFLAKIFQKLVRAGILTSERGRGGGFELTRPAHQVSLMRIVEAMEGPWPLDGCAVGMARCDKRRPCAQHQYYEPIREGLRQYMNKTTLADLAFSLKGMNGRAAGATSKSVSG